MARILRCDCGAPLAFDVRVKGEKAMIELFCTREARPLPAFEPPNMPTVEKRKRKKRRSK